MKKIEGYDEAILGPVSKWDGNEQIAVLAYDAEVIRKMMMRDGMDAADAREYIEYNIEGAYMGKDTPLLVWTDDLWWDEEEDLDWTAGND